MIYNFDYLNIQWVRYFLYQYYRKIVHHLPITDVKETFGVSKPRLSVQTCIPTFEASELDLHLNDDASYAVLLPLPVLKPYCSYNYLYRLLNSALFFHMLNEVLFPHNGRVLWKSSVKRQLHTDDEVMDHLEIHIYLYPGFERYYADGHAFWKGYMFRIESTFVFADFG